ncbi:hypothetical protein [Cellulomonas soli]|uniref:Uncharacterized protein n=1 Tax=Cellulomonas soli TaxID=931535 RepID=A0A512PFA0_9CELL|nr:hypothetical protein [Cellulomonas soli]NYI59335.1 hypothetical protein [Cellulomonas soli]GEP69877.1 hypothetical protein CSO01_25920 [Cellulomonas soli]
MTASSTRSGARRSAALVLTTALALGLTGCGLRDARTTTDPAEGAPATTSGASAQEAAAGTAPTSPAADPSAGASIDEDALDALDAALAGATAAAEQVEQEMAQDEEG